MASASVEFKSQFLSQNLERLYHDYVSKSSAIGIDRINHQVSEKNLKREIELVAKKAKDGSYRFSQYKEKLISKGAGKPPRVISIPTYRDRITLRACCNVLQSAFSGSINLKIPQMVIADIKTALSTDQYSFFIKVDVEKFYPSIDHDVLTNKLKSKIRKVQVVSLLQNAVRTTTVPFPDKSKASEKKGVPQGLSISNVLAEIYLHKFDLQMDSNQDVAYFRYVDDILILCKENPDAVFANLAAQLKDDYCLTVHPLNGLNSKSRVGNADESFSFLGYHFSDRLASVKKESLTRLEESLANIFTTYKYKRHGIMSEAIPHLDRMKKLDLARTILFWRLNLRITGCVFENARKGWIFYFSQIDEQNINQLWSLDKTVERLLERFDIEIIPYKIKTFVRTFFESHRKNPTGNGYIPNFDTVSVLEQRKILSQYFAVANLDHVPDDRVTEIFNQKIRRVTQELERYIQDLS